jgi:DNA-binding CsgD family transcriptional regulator
MPDDHQPTSIPLDIVLDAEREIAQIGPDDSYGLYDTLHRIAQRIARAEAFYVCLYSEAEQSLYFPFNYDNGEYDFPSTFPLGNGPTSWVIRHKEPFVWKSLDDQECRTPSGVRFGDLSVSTHSAVHLPIRAPGANADAPLLGVLSAQCYTPHAYDPQALRLFAWLADRAGVALAHAQATSLAAERQQQASALADRFVQMMAHITQNAQGVSALIPTDAPALRQAAAELLRSCHRSQTEANQLPLRLDRLPAPPPLPATAVPSVPLTGREREILSLLAAGRTYGEIAQDLFITTNTVKDHMKRIFAKIGVSSRHEAARWFRASSGQ